MSQLWRLLHCPQLLTGGYSRVAFPASFACFNLLYWIICLHISNVSPTAGLVVVNPQESSFPMQVIVEEDPPQFEITPDPSYLSKLGTSLEIPCSANAPNGTTPRPLITWQRRDGRPLPEGRARVVDGTLFLEDIQQLDHGEYECVASNEVASLSTSTRVIVEGTRPHAPYNITATAAMYYVTLNWHPGHSDGPDFRHSYVVWYRKLGESSWETVTVTPYGSQRITVRQLAPGTTYQFQIVGTNDLGEGHSSGIISVATKGTAE